MIEAIKTEGLKRREVSAFHLKSIPLWIKLVLFVWIFTALFADQLANDLPLSCQIDGERHYPALVETFAKIRGDANFRLRYLGKTDQMDAVIRAPIPYSPQTIDRSNTGFVSPLAKQQLSHWSFRHWLGTDRLGRDIASGMIHGSRVAFIVGLLSVFFSFLIGVPLGAAAGYYGDRQILISRIAFFLSVGLILIWMYFLYLHLIGANIAAIWVWSALFLAMVIPYISKKLIRHRSFKKFPVFWLKSYTFPLDLILLRLIEIFRSLPNLFILLALLAVFGQTGMLTISMILALLMWPTFARYTRAEFLSLREKEFVSAARLFRKSDFRIIFTDILPNAKAPLIVITAFGISAAILAESTLSFLGLGLGVDQVSWGSLLSEARRYFPAWWMAVFPGFAIFIIIYALNSLGDSVRN